MPRINMADVDQKIMEPMMKMETLIANSSLDKTLYELIKLRASLLNGCAYCIDMHSRDLREMGETDQRMDLITVWREVPDFYTEKEKAVLELTECVTRISDHGVPDQTYNRVMEHFSEQEFLVLIMAINAINCWNRISISTQNVPEKR